MDKAIATYNKQLIFNSQARADSVNEFSIVIQAQAPQSWEKCQSQM